MNLTKFSIKRPVSVLIVVLALIVFGFSAIMTTPIEMTPDLEMPVMLINTVYAGAGPEEVADLVSDVIETAVSTLSGVKNVQAMSQENVSMVLLEFEYGTNMDLARMDLQKNLDMYKNMLPESASDPTILEISMDMLDTLTLSAQATGDVNTLYYVEDVIVPRFEKLGGVGSVSVSGGARDYISVELDQAKLRQYGLDMNTIVNIVKAADFSMPAGSVERGDQSLILRGGAEYQSTAAIKNIPITLRSGDIIRLSDVAEVKEATKANDSVSRFDGHENITVSIKKRQSASTLAVSKQVIREMNAINSEHLGVELSVIMDTSESIVRAVSNVASTLLLGIVMSMVVLFLFFGDFKASLIVGSSMPISLLTTLCIMSMTGITLNLLSLGGLVIGVGMMVDNSIVVLESCFRTVDANRSYKDAVLQGTKFVTSSIIASTITTIVVFLPISLLKGMSGQLFRQVGFTIIFSLTASLISALTLVPLFFMKIRPRERRELWINRELAKLQESYGNFMPRTFRHKKLVVLFSVALLVLSFALLPFIGFELMPAMDEGAVTISVEAKPGLQIEKLTAILDQIERDVQEQPDVERYSLSGRSGSGTLRLYLREDRDMTTREMVDLMREKTRDFIGCKVEVEAASSMAMMGGSDSLSVKLQSLDLNQLDGAARLVRDELEKSESVVSTSSSLSDGNPQAEIIVDPIKAAAQGLTPMQVIASVSTMVQGKDAFSIRQNNQEYQVKVEFPEGSYDTVSDLSGILLPTPMGRQVPLLDIAEIRYSDSPQMIQRLNNQYVVTVSAQLRSQDSARTSNALMAHVMGMELPEGVTISMGGSMEAMMEEFSALAGALVTAILLVFMVMAMQFESMRFSLVVMMSIPFSLIGAFGLLFLGRSTVSMVSFVGVIMLVGIVINNGILLIDTASQLREEGLDREAALILAGKTRLRPILMTTLTTILSMVPMALGIGGEGTEMMRSMALVIIGGLITSTILTVVLIPTFYLLFDKKKKGFWDRDDELAGEDALPED